MPLIPLGDEVVPNVKVIETWHQYRTASGSVGTIGNHPITDLDVTISIPTDHPYNHYFVRGYAKVGGLHTNSIAALRLYGEQTPGSGTLVTYSDESTDISNTTGAAYHTVQIQALHFPTSYGNGQMKMQLWMHVLTASMTWIGKLVYTLELCYMEDPSKMHVTTSNFTST